jgi:hypothetical protein
MRTLVQDCGHLHQQMMEYLVVASIVISGSLFALVIGIRSIDEEMERKRDARKEVIRRRVAR